MLQYPTNVYPQDTAIAAAVSPRMYFTFNGDILTTVWSRFYDYNSGELVADVPSGATPRTPQAYNGERILTPVPSQRQGEEYPLQQGNDYMYQMMLTQSTVDGSDNIYDMPIVRGEVESVSGTEIMIEDRITNIYEWNVYQNVCSPSIIQNTVYAGAIIKIGNESHFIQSYNRMTGKLIVDSAFSSDITGKTYIILCNYLITPMYYFMYRNSPTLTLTSEIVPTGTAYYTDPYPPNIISEGAYTPPVDGDMIKYYIMRLYWRTSDNRMSGVVEESDKIYSQKINYKFFNDFIDHAIETSVVHSITTDIIYHVGCVGKTQNGLSFGATASDFTITGDRELNLIESVSAKCVDEHAPEYIYHWVIPETSQQGIYRRRIEQHINQSVVIEAHLINTETARWIQDVTLDVYRKDLETGDVKHLPSVELRISSHTASHNTIYVTDWSVPNRGSFEYILLPRNINTGIPYLSSRKTVQVDTNFIGYTITALQEDSQLDAVTALYNAKKQYKKGQTWAFHGEIQDSNLIQNLNRTVQSGAGVYATMSSGDNNYLSGTLSVDMGYINCSDGHYKDTIDMVNALREFISKHEIYVLKTQKGDVLMVNIVGTPSVAYMENTPNVPSSISVDWVECDNIDNYNIISQVDAIIS